MKALKSQCASGGTANHVEYLSRGSEGAVAPEPLRVVDERLVDSTCAQFRKRINDATPTGEAADDFLRMVLLDLAPHCSDRSSGKLRVTALPCHRTELGKKQSHSRYAVIKIEAERREPPFAFARPESARSTRHRRRRQRELRQPVSDRACGRNQLRSLALAGDDCGR